MKWLTALSWIAASSLAGSAAHSSTVVFSNLGPGDTYNCCLGGTVSGLTSTLLQDFDQGSSFRPSVTVPLESLEVAVSLSSGTNALDIWLMSSVGGRPGSIIESFSVVGMPSFGSTSTSLTLLPSLLNPQLLAGTRYWVVASASGDTWAAFNVNSTGDTGRVTRLNGGTWSDLVGEAVAYRVNGLDVPEPASLALLATFLGVIVARSARMRQASR